MGRERVLVAGGGGYIARHFLRACAEEFAFTALVRQQPASPVPGVHYVCTDLSQTLDSGRLPQSVDAVLHLAQSSGYRQHPEGADEVLAVNVGSALALAGWARVTGCVRFVYASTAGFNPQGVERAMENVPLEPESFYLRTKGLAETLLAESAGPITLTLVRPYTVYGPDQSGRLVPSIVARVLRGEPVILDGDDEGMRLTPVYVADVVEALRRIVRGRIGGTFNLAGDDLMTIRGIAEAVARRIGRKAIFEHRPSVPARWLAGSNARLHAACPDLNWTPFERGLAAAVPSDPGATTGRVRAV